MVAYLIVIITVLAASTDASSIGPCATSFLSPPPVGRINAIQTSSSSKDDIQLQLQLNERPSTNYREAAGISPGIGLWKDLRRSLKRRRRRGNIVQVTLDGLRTKTSGRRRRRLSSRFRNYYLKRRRRQRISGAKNGNDDGDNYSNSNLEEEDIESNTDVDSMRARSGVLRTRIRLRQGELTDLDLLMKDVSLELKRQQWEHRDESNPGYKSVFSYDQLGKETTKGDDNNLGNINDIMNENSLEVMNKKWKEQVKEIPVRSSNTIDIDLDGIDADLEDSDFLMDEFQLDLMKKRSLELQSAILLDRIELQRLERRILCCESTELGVIENLVGNSLERMNEFDGLSNPVTVARRQAKKFSNTFGESTSVLLRKLDRVSTRSGKNNRDYKSVSDFVVQETAAGGRIVGNLLSNPSQLTQLIDPETPSLMPHVPAILARLDRLETHVSPILSQVLNNKQHLRTIEPYLDEILERFDDIEPHLPWILDHIDILAPYTGLLLKHIDELLLYAEVDEYEAGSSSKDNYAFADQLLPYLEVYVSQLDLVGPHLPLLRPHLPLLLKHNRIKILSPHVGVLFAKGYTDLSASANMDILLFYFGWALRIPFVPRLFFSLPRCPGVVSFLANRLPKRLVRGRCCDVSCYVDNNYGGGWNNLQGKE
mmetsp:Transcript_27354/g.42981  ORF Transcript_27354/g.42981 Transcript_27354/m.42981 type:complete len:654 (+) Transcript_27354:87-2048(+)